MQFRKTAVAVAIAGIAAAAPQIASADTVLSGAVEIQLKGSDDDTLSNPEDADGPTEGDPSFAAGDALVGVVATHTMNNGLDAYGSIRLDGDGLSGSPVTDDNIYVGIKGGFGDLRFGEVPVAAEYGQVAGDLFDQTGGINGGVSYTGGFGPATVGLSYAPAKNEDTIGVGAKFSIGGFAIGIGGEQRDELTNFSVGASFGFAGASVAVHYVDQEVGDGIDNSNIIGLKVGYGIAGVSLGLTHHIQSTDGDGEETKTRLDLGYGLGGGMTASARYNIDDGDTDGADDWRLMLSKSF